MNLIEYTECVTGKLIIRKEGVWSQEDTEIRVHVEDGKLDMEGLLHELAHYAVATKKERKAPNLMLASHHTQLFDPDIGEVRDGHTIDYHRSRLREHQARFLEYRVFEELSQYTPEGIDQMTVPDNNPDVEWFHDLSDLQRQSIKETIQPRMECADVEFEELCEVVSETDMRHAKRAV